MKATLATGITIEGTPEELERFIQPNTTQPIPFIGGLIGTNACPMGGTHEYPKTWNSITPAPCSKCGQGLSAIGSYIVSTDLDQRTISRLMAQGYTVIDTTCMSLTDIDEAIRSSYSQTRSSSERQKNNCDPTAPTRP